MKNQEIALNGGLFAFFFRCEQNAFAQRLAHVDKLWHGAAAAPQRAERDGVSHACRF
jgi:hypothetical protein